MDYAEEYLPPLTLYKWWTACTLLNVQAVYMWRHPAEPTPSKRRVCIQRHKSHLRLHEGFSVVAIICLVLKCQNGNMISIPNHMLRCTAILMNQLNLSYTNSTFPYATKCIPIYYLSGIDLGAVCIFLNAAMASGYCAYLGREDSVWQKRPLHVAPYYIVANCMC